MITLEKEKVTVNPDIKVIKRDGRMVTFDSSKIYEAILKASETITPITPLIETKLEGIANRVVAEINDRFSHNIKIYEIQSIVEHELLEANEYAIAQEYINYRTKRDFELFLRLLISISPLTNWLIKIRLLFMRMPIRIVIYTIHNVI